MAFYLRAHDIRLFAYPRFAELLREGIRQVETLRAGEVATLIAVPGCTPLSATIWTTVFSSRSNSCTTPALNAELFCCLIVV